MTDNVKTLPLVSGEEHNRIARAVLLWLNTYPDKPVTTINYEQLAADKKGMALSTIQGTYKTRQYILGGYEAQYQFKLIYRLHPDISNDERLKADELLNTLGDWAAANPPELGGNVTVRRVRADSGAALFAAYDNGDEDHQILMTLIYEVI